MTANLLRTARSAALGFAALAAAVMPAMAEPLRVAGVFTAPIQQQWVSRIRTALMAEVEAGEIEYVWAENVPNSDYIRVLREYAQSGVDLIIGESSGIGREARATADAFPGVYFLVRDPHGSNFSPFETILYEPAYLMGVMAGALTEAGVIGLLGGFPLPALTNRPFNAFMEGARMVNEDVAFRVTFIESWFDPPRAREAAFGMVEEGADVLYAERDGVVGAAREQGVLAFGHMIDRNLGENGAGVVVTSALWDMGPAVRHAIEGVRAGDLGAEDFRRVMSLSAGGGSLAPLHDFEGVIDPELVAMVEDLRAQIVAGKVAVPINDERPTGTRWGVAMHAAPDTLPPPGRCARGGHPSCAWRACRGASARWSPTRTSA